MKAQKKIKVQLYKTSFWKLIYIAAWSIGLLLCRLAKNISSQIKERLNKSHDSFAAALKQLEQKHSGRLDRIEEGRLKLRKVHAPRVAKVALESTSLMDVILHGNGACLSLSATPPSFSLFIVDYLFFFSKYFLHVANLKFWLILIFY